MNIKEFRKNYDLTTVLIIGLYTVFLYCQVTQGQFTQKVGSDSMEFSYGVSPLSSMSMYTASIIAIAIGLVRGFKTNIRYANYYTVLVLLSFVMFLWFVVDSSLNGLTAVLRSSSCNPTIYFLFWSMYISMNDKSWNTAVKLARILGPILLVWSLVQSFSFQSLFGGYIGNSPQIVLLGNGICTMFVAMLGHKEKDSFWLVCLFICSIFCGIATAVIYGNRSWNIQCVLLVLIYVYKQSNRERFRISTIIITALIVYIIFRVISSNLTDSLDFLISRGFSDSRSWQYVEIYNQFSFFDLFFGKGTFGTYKSALYGDYGFIDNTTVMVWFHFGFIAVCCLLYLLLKAPIYLMLSSKSTKAMKITSYICILWFFALNGLSVYNTIIFDLRNVMMAFALGRCVKLCYDLKKAKVVYK